MGVAPQDRDAAILLAYNQPVRPWLSLYSNWLKPRDRGGVEVEWAPIQQLLPDELMHVVLSYLDPYSLAKAGCSTRMWRGLADHARHWEVACSEAFRATRHDWSFWQRLVSKSYRHSWKHLFVETPHLRFEGLYVSRNTYIRAGCSEWRSGSSTHLVSYFRYYRFFPDGTLLYRTSPLVLSKVIKSLLSKPKADVRTAREEHVFSGRYIVKGNNVYSVLVYPNSNGTEIRSRLGIRSTHPGANDRLDVESIFSFDRLSNITSSMMPELNPDEHGSGDVRGTRKDHGRGLSACVFVPWEQVPSSPLNLPVEKMDFYVAG